MRNNAFLEKIRRWWRNHRPTVPLNVSIKSFFRNSNVLQWIYREVNIDIIFVFFLTFLVLDIPTWQRILVALGFYGVYRMIIDDIKATIRVSK